jgi:hypothetical protein
MPHKPVLTLIRFPPFRGTDLRRFALDGRHGKHSHFTRVLPSGSVDSTSDRLRCCQFFGAVQPPITTDRIFIRVIKYREFSRFGRFRALVNARREVMAPRNKRVDEEDGKLLEDQPLEWAEEDQEIEDRKPDLGGTEEDTSEL